ncbi:hypothetical protein [Klebsiella phage vB_KshKPC-M]|nr:hypothetical protein [Klebsiella phage vB_KshKPC-M]
MLDAENPITSVTAKRATPSSTTKTVNPLTPRPFSISVTVRNRSLAPYGISPTTTSANAFML